MERQFDTDCEGPISKNDNAFEMAQFFLPEGDVFFAKISKYDDYLADILHKPGYKAGDTLRLILPFFRAYGVTELDIKDFSSRNVLIVPGADSALKIILEEMPVFIISTSYRPYINSLCKAIGFPVENTYCTELAIDEYDIPDSEIQYLKSLYIEIMRLPDIEIPMSADLDDASIESIQRLDRIFWEEIPDMESGRLLTDINPIGGFEKANAIRDSCMKTGVQLSDVIYSGDSITDVEAMRLVSSAGGCAISFNGNRYAIQAADIACISPNALILAVLALVFKEGVDLRSIALEWDSERVVIQRMLESRFSEFSFEDIEIRLVDSCDKQDLIKRSEIFRKTIRGSHIGRLG